nr:MAG TPA: portal protein [Caudoviricetes sp.]
MILFDLFRNYLNALVGRNQEFEKLLAAKDISAVKEGMSNRMDMAIAALKEYDVASHEIMKREDKIITDKKGNFIRFEPVWKLPIPYQVYINEIALVFLYGRPVKWIQQSDGTDEAFQKYQEVIEHTHFNSKLRQCKRIAGSETESAMLFRVFRNEKDEPDVQIRVLAKSKGDEIYTRWDQYENLISVAWGYYAKEAQDNIVYHFDIYTPAVIYRCTRKSLGWEVIQEVNFIGKIPLILFQQDKEWNGAEALIHREELIASRTADTNDYFADPIAIMASELIKNLPEKKEAAKLLITNDAEGVDKAAKYLTWDNAPQSKKDEVEWLQDQILNKTFTPKISLDTLKSLGNLSAKAMRTVMMLAEVKAAKHKEVHDELLDRTASLILAIIGNVLDVRLKSQCETLKIGHEFQEPFGDDIVESIENIIKSIDGGILSTESGVEMNPIVKDKKLEMERLKAEEEERAQKQQQIFGDIDGGGPQSATDGDDDPNNDGADDDPKKKQQQK